MLFLAGATVSQIARQMGHSRELIRKWRNMSEFQHEMAVIRKERLESFLDGLAENANLGQRHIGQVIRDPASDPRLKLQAAKSAVATAVGVVIGGDDDEFREAVMTDDQRQERIVHIFATGRNRILNSAAIDAQADSGARTGARADGPDVQDPLS
jgi:hypothetical protein